MDNKPVSIYLYPACGGMALFETLCHAAESFGKTVLIQVAFSLIVPFLYAILTGLFLKGKRIENSDRRGHREMDA